MRPLRLLDLKRDFALVVRLALADFRHEGRLSLCAVIGMAAVLAPLLVLYGLKFGIVSGMTAQLASDPHARELRPLGQGSFDEPWLAQLATHPETGWLEPATRFLAAGISLRNPARSEGEPVNAELWPSHPGDPLAPGLIAAPLPLERIVLSQSAADKLKAAPGTTLTGRIGRHSRDGEAQAATVTLTVAAVVPAALIDRDAALVAPALVLAAEDYREGLAVPALGWPGEARPEQPRRYARFRLFARDIHGVAALRDHLAGLGVQVGTRLAEIEMIERIDRNLTTLFLLVAGLASAGYFLSLAINLWATTRRKHRDLAVLRLMGLSSGAIALFPAVNALATAALGLALAFGLYGGIAFIINRLFTDGLAAGQVVCRLAPDHVLLAALVTLGFSLVAALAAGFEAARVAPSQGLRDE